MNLRNGLGQTGSPIVFDPGASERPSRSARHVRAPREEWDRLPMRSGMLIAAFAAGILSAASAGAQDIEKGGQLYKKQCRSCHGPTAKGLASYPKLVGKPVEYLVQRLEQYRAGERLGPNTPLMAPRARKLSDEDIADIANFIVTTFK